MEFVEGITLRQLLQTLKLDILAIMKIVEQLAKAMVELHEFEPPMLHRDLKPENIIIMTSAGNALKLVDFGISRTMEQTEN